MMNRIKFLREQLHMTQEELATELNLSKGIISLYENEVRKPSIEVLLNLSELFKCSTDYILGITSHKNPKEELEAELYKLDLTEREFDNLIKTFNEKSEFEITTQYLSDLPNNSQKRETLIIGIILGYTTDYIPEFSNNITKKQEEELNKTIEANLSKAKSMVNSLDKSKIIHDYNIEQEFKFAYHKETEGLTDKEIIDALRFYKQIKYGR